MNLLHNFGKVLIFAAHADDETLGYGGIISKLIVLILAAIFMF